jgi:aminomethyltransferase
VTALGYKNAYLSVQGPASRTLLQGLTNTDLSAAAMTYFSCRSMTLAEVPMLVSRTGYSGELGYELFYPSEYAEHVLDTLLAAGQPLGVLPCGLGALRSLRIEKRYPLYGLDLDETTTPVEAGLGWTVKLTKPAFEGREVLARQKQNGTERHLVLLLLASDAPVPPVGAAVSHSGAVVGKVTSADRGYTVGRTLAMAYVPPALAVDGQTVVVAGVDGDLPAVVSLRAPYDPDGLRVRS